MTSKLTITDERVISVIERLEHYASNLKWTNVRGAQDLLTAADGLRELQERRKADSEPVAEVVSIYGDPEAFVEREIRPLVGIQQMPYGTKLYRHAQPAPAGVDDDVRNVIGLLGNNEWVDHCTSTELGQLLESEITRLFNWRSAQLAQAVPDDVLEALRKVARIRLDLNNFDGGHRGLAFCLSDAEETLIEVVNRRAAMLAAAPQEVKK